ncbi:MAG: hypothetical protein ACR2FY_08675 [Pirellulaceae bacterium]
MKHFTLPRRDFLASSAALAASSALAAPPAKGASKSVAAIITAYEKGLHGDVLIGKILEGWNQDGGPGPALKLASMYVEQFTDKDLARTLAKKYKVPTFDTIEKTVTVGGTSIPVDGVISVGEHGNYPWNEKEQHLYPRRRFFQEITDTFEKYGRVVPVFNDKHLGPVWEDAKWMYDRAQKMKVPLMAGSSLVNTFRDPEMNVPMGCDIEAAVGIGYSGLDIYGAHALECFQSLVERRRGPNETPSETGVKWVQCLQGDAMWKAADDGTVRKDLLTAAFAALKVTPHQREELRKDKDSALFLFQYADGLLGSIFMLPNSVGGNAIALKLKGEPRILSTRFEERTEPYYPHFAYLLKAIERMIHTGRVTYPVERTLLTSGILDRALTSRFQKHEKLLTPELAIRYKAVDYPHAPKPELESGPVPR